MVSGFALPVSIGSDVSQCADASRTARGLGSLRPSAAQAWLEGVSSMPFIGEPCEMKSVGRRDMMGSLAEVDFVGAIPGPCCGNGAVGSHAPVRPRPVPDP